MTVYAQVGPKPKTTKERGYHNGWEALRARYVQEHPYCVRCKEDDGRLVAVEHVDHIIDIKLNPALRLDEDNLQSLCATHHGRKTAKEQAHSRSSRGNYSFG